MDLSRGKNRDNAAMAEGGSAKTGGEKRPFRRRIGEEEVRRAMQILQKYKAGKARLEKRLIESEQWWKMRHWEWMELQGNPYNAKYPSAWLFNTIINKHSDAIQNYPEPAILPREEQDKKVAQTLRAVIPCILEQNGFEEVYSDASWNKLKQGTAIYGIFWDGSKLNGLGDISIAEIDPLTLFWEPGITDIQKSANVFQVELMDKDAVKQRWPHVGDSALSGSGLTLSKYMYDDNVPTEDKVPVVDWYYRTYYDGRRQLHYCKFVGTTVLYASENDTERPTAMQMVQAGVDPMGAPVMEAVEVETGPSVAETGWYEHGDYPFVFDRLFPVKGSPFGFGYVDVCKHGQEQIDILNQGITINALMNAAPRYFFRDDCGVNEEEFSDWRRGIVHVTGSMSSDAVMPINTPSLNGNAIDVMNNKITEMKETSGNTDASNGITGGVTSASGIAAQQQASGKTSRAATMSAYRAFGRLIYQLIELIRQFYDAPRTFRITGSQGEEQFVLFNNAALKPVAQGNDFGIDMGMRLPVFDIKVSAASKTVYTRNAQNEMAASLYSMGVFNPQQVDQSLMLLDMMDFEGKDELMGKVSRMGTVYQMYAQMSQIAMGLAQRYEPQTAEAIAATLMQHGGGVAMPAAAASVPRTGNAADAQADRQKQGKEIAQVRRARENADRAAEVNPG